MVLVVATSMMLMADSCFSQYRDRTWVCGKGKVIRILDDDLDPPCHQRFIISDKNGHTILVAHNIEKWPRVADLAVGNMVSFRGEFIDNDKGGVLHWTHPDLSGKHEGGWIRVVDDVTSFTAAGKYECGAESELPRVRREYFAGRGPIASRRAAPVNDDWPDTGYWLSVNSNARHNKRCENYRKTRGYPCKRAEGRPCGKCGG